MCRQHSVLRDEEYVVGVALMAMDVDESEFENEDLAREM
jgi:hypothetical protein